MRKKMKINERIIWKKEEDRRGGRRTRIKQKKKNNKNKIKDQKRVEEEVKSNKGCSYGI